MSFLYRYVKYNSYEINNIINNSVTFTNPTCFNDTREFDFGFYLSDESSQQMEEQERAMKQSFCEWGADQIIAKTKAKYKVLCLTDQGDCSYMWQKYADGDSGLMIKYNTDNFKLVDSEIELLSPPYKVNYLDGKLMIPLDFVNDRFVPNKKMLEILYTKGMCWGREKEVRYILSDCSSDKRVTKKLNKDAIDSIYLGRENKLLPSDLNKLKEVIPVYMFDKQDGWVKYN